MDSPLSVLLLSLEFLSPFSGNGQYSRCIVRGLKRAGARVLVVSGRPEAAPLSSQDDEAKAHALAPHGLIDIPLPQWGRLDRGSSWEEFSKGCCDSSVLNRITEFNGSVVCCVDYHATHAWARLKSVLPQPLPPMVYLNFRLFCMSVGLHTGDDAAFYRRAEREAMLSSALTVALCRQDALLLQALAAGLDPLTGEKDTEESVLPPASYQTFVPVRMVTLLPPLRSDVSALVMEADEKKGAMIDGTGTFPSTSILPGYSFITSLVRLSPEKNAAAVPTLLHALESLESGGGGVLSTKYGAQPFFAGAGDTSQYAIHIKKNLASLPHPITLCPTFMGPRELADVLRLSALNLHPCLADAYGMTIVEAAAWGVPSLVHVPSPSPVAPLSATTEPTLSPDALFTPDKALELVREKASVLNSKKRSGALIIPPAPPSSACLRVLLEPLLLASPMASPTNLGYQLYALSKKLPPVGACDLLAPNPLDSSSSPAIFPFDFSASAQDQGKRFLPILSASMSVWRAQRDGGGGQFEDNLEKQYDMISRIGRERALAWSEECHGEAFLALLHGVLNSLSG